MFEEIKIHCIDNDRYGFTIPYLYKVNFDQSQIMTIPEILQCLAEAEDKYLISYCTDLEEYILGLPKRESAPINMYKNFGSLHYDQDSLGIFKSKTELFEYFTNEYQCRIDRGTFSKNIETLQWE